MKKNDKEQLKNKSKDELKKILSEKNAKKEALRRDIRMGKNAHLKDFYTLKKEIAVVNTIIGEKE